jgi:hypothetical protein
MTIMTIGFGLFVLYLPTFSLPKIIIFQIIAGTGVGLVFQSPLIALQSLVQLEDFATATATSGFVRNVGCAMSIVLGGVLFQNGIEIHSAVIESAVGLDVARKFAGASAGANVGLIAALPEAQRVVVKAAYGSSLRQMWILYTCTAGFGLLASVFAGKQPLPAMERTDAKKSGPDLELQ